MALVLRVTAATPLSSSRLSTKMALRPTSSNKTTSNVSFTSKKGGGRKLPILLFDIMDTIVRDPFYHDIPNFFGMSFEELIECKDPTAWIEFEKGFIDEIVIHRHTMIEEKLNVSTYLSWMFCSSLYGKRKPDPAFYLEVLRNLKVDPTNCIFVDDRQRNVEAATEVGIIGLHFKNAKVLREDLFRMGIDISIEHRKAHD
ncbi:flavin mononucleotide hydrolase 1, chloroplatic isoform X2 [Ricinus communis]|uniref:flavin mononucleotide hydrolase 1, chloroplatic isoform X2 n=1 Tax=Ricinus communis TaxID=3988 RepID=UPI0007728B52|nr:flavin mononucleotide hydrolase 1, chloroplatic isoform X2 [Ricinus communis]